MLRFHPAVRKAPAASLSLPAILALSIAFLLTGCGGSGGSGSSSPTPSPSTAKEWTWMSGSNTENAAGVYGTQGAPAAANVPGARQDAVSWTDHSGNLWLFGGQGYDWTGTLGSLNDLWEFNPTTKQWAWISGSNTKNAAGVYGTQGVPAAANIPGGRSGAVSWIDSSGNLWLFGGYGYYMFNYSATLGYFNDLWEFNPAQKSWTWVSGSDNGDTVGYDGTKGVPAAANVPGARESAVGWIDSSGSLWLFGGYGYWIGSSNGLCPGSCMGLLDDLWEFNPTTKQWAWMSRNNALNAIGVYGTKGVPAAANIPGGRENAVSWTDSSDNLWLFGGQGELNDLWEFSPATNEWTWMSGSMVVVGSQGAVGVYGTQGVPAAANVPSGRAGAVSWMDTSGNLWLFGGNGYDATGVQGNLNDLWRYQP